MRLRFKNITNKRLFIKPINIEKNKMGVVNSAVINDEMVSERKKDTKSVVINNTLKEEKKTTSKDTKKVVYAKKDVEINNTKEENPTTSKIDEDNKIGIIENNKEENL